MTEEQKKLMDRTYGALSVLRVDADHILKEDPDSMWGEMLDNAIKCVETMIKEWAFAIGHPKEISEETIMEIVDRVTPIVGEVVKKRIAEGKL